MSVRYSTAVEFVREYADNLSNSGLFIKGAQDLQPLSVVNVEITLPGAAAYMVKCEVAHVMTPEAATRFGRSAGAGLAILKSPAGFEDALSDYLRRLGRRADHRVLVKGDAVLQVLADAGYKATPAPSAAGLAEAMVHSDEPVIGVVVPRRAAKLYNSAARAIGAGDVVIAMDDEGELDSVLRTLDARF